MMNTLITVNITLYVGKRCLEEKSMLLAHFKKAFPLTLLGHSLKVELTDYCFILKVTSVFPTPTQAKQTEDDEHFAND